MGFTLKQAQRYKGVSTVKMLNLVFWVCKITKSFRMIFLKKNDLNSFFSLCSFSFSKCFELWQLSKVKFRITLSLDVSIITRIPVLKSAPFWCAKSTMNHHWNERDCEVQLSLRMRDTAPISLGTYTYIHIYISTLREWVRRSTWGSGTLSDRTV